MVSDVSGFESDQVLYREILDHLHEGVYLVDPQRVIRYWNSGAERISGYSAREVVGSSCADNILIHVDDEGTSLCTHGCPLAGTMADGESREAEVYLHHKQGHRLPVHVRTAPLRDVAGRIVGGIEIFSENRARPALREEIEMLRRLALQDNLTQIANRRYTEMTLQARHDEFTRYGWPYGVLLIDIDHFKRFNDTYGHDVGDRVLQTVAKTLTSNVRSFDLVGRWGGEEFLVILEKIDRQSLLCDRAELLRRLVEHTGARHQGMELSVTMSCGGSVVRKGEQPEDVVKRADELLYRSKETGRNRCTFGS